jgi:hypothetical protein
MVQGITPNSEIGALSVRDWHNLPRPARAVGVNVAGEASRVRVEAQLARWRLAPEWLALSVRTSPRTPFTTPAWNALWWRHLRRWRTEHR